MRVRMNNSGSTSLEFALVAPIWLAFVVGIVQAGMLTWLDNEMHAVVDVTARCMAVNVNVTGASKCYDASSMRTYAMSISWPALWSATDFHLNDSNAGTCTGGSQVSISYAVSLLHVVPITLAAKACFPNFS
jgi:Flp pilus assembly protein TadG